MKMFFSRNQKEEMGIWVHPTVSLKVEQSPRQSKEEERAPPESWSVAQGDMYTTSLFVEGASFLEPFTLGPGIMWGCILGVGLCVVVMMI